MRKHVFWTYGDKQNSILTQVSRIKGGQRRALKVFTLNLKNTTDSLLVGFPCMMAFLFFFPFSKYVQQPECELGL